MQNVINQLNETITELNIKTNRQAARIMDMHAARLAAANNGDEARVDELNHLISRRRAIFNKARGTVAGIKLAIAAIELELEASK